MNKQLKLTMEVLEARRLHPAMRSEEDIEAAATAEEPVVLHPLVLCHTRNNHDLAYIHPERLLQELEKRGEFLNLLTMEFEKKVQEVTPPTPEETAPEEEAPEEETIQVYTETELKKLSWKEIRAVAKADEEIPGNKSHDELIKTLTGRPKFPLK